jgi:succinylglutamate desuccinylase
MKLNKYNPIINIYGKGKPAVAIVGCLHGDELVGKKVIDVLTRERLIRGTLMTIIGNPLAVKKKKRFIKQDLNRSFSGKKNGKIEEKIAYAIIKIIKNADYMIDVHSSTTDTRDVAIVKRSNLRIKKMLKTIAPRRVVFMPKGFGDKALINFCSGVSFEYGKHNSEHVYQKSLKDTKKFLASLGMIKTKKNKQKKYKSEYYKVFNTENRPKGFNIKKGIKDFILIKKGDLLGTVRGRKIFAKENFYPFLFGEKAYKDIIGFKTRKVPKI